MVDKYLKDTNPNAYEELEEYLYEGISVRAVKKEKIRNDDISIIGKWKCPNCNSYWYSTISYRGTLDEDRGCIFCEYNRKNSMVQIVKQELQENYGRHSIITFVYGNESHFLIKKVHNYDIDDFKELDELYLDEGDTPISIYERYPTIAEEWSNKNIWAVDQIWSVGDCDYAFLWECKKCHREYEYSLQKKLRDGENACPYCSGRKTTENMSIKYWYPELEHRWSNWLNIKRFDELTLNDKVGYFVCRECGVVYINTIKRESANKECIYCKDGMTNGKLQRICKEYAGPIQENGYLNPEGKAPVDWICSECGCKYPASMQERFHFRKSCTYCVGLHVIPGKTSFKALHPEIEEELIQDELVDFDTDKISPKYQSKAFNWLCRNCGNKYQLSILNRVNLGCPYCNGRIAIPGKTSFKALYPEIEEELIQDELVDFDTDYIFPDYLKSKTFNWSCKKYHEKYQSSIISRIKLGCPYCNGRLAIPGKTSFKALYPEIEAELIQDELIDFDTDYIFPNERKNKTYNWECKEYHEKYQSSIINRINLGCPYCNGRLAISGKTSFKALYPEIEAELIQDELIDFDTDHIFPNERKNKTYNWECKEYHEKYQSSIINRINLGCPYCNGRLAISGKTSFKALYPEIEAELIQDELVDFDTDYIFPDYLKSKTFNWECKKYGEKYQSSIINRVEEGCPYCEGRLAIPGKTSFKALYPEIEKELIQDELVDFDTDYIFPDYLKSKTFNWECKKYGEKYQSSIINRVEEGCPYCEGRLAIPGKTSFKALYPEIEKELIQDELVDFDTDYIFPDYLKSKTFNWSCKKCDGKYQSSIISRIEEGCPYCNNRKALYGLNSILDTEPIVMKEWLYPINMLLGLNPKNMLAQDSRKVWWKCSDCGQTYKQSPQKRVLIKKRKMKACPHCKGYRRNQHHFF